MSDHMFYDSHGQLWLASTEPRRWELPPEPGPEVTAVRNSVGELWVRRADGMWGWYLGVAGVSSTHPKPWRALLVGYGPLTDATTEFAEESR